MRQKRGGVDERGPLPRMRVADGASTRLRHSVVNPKKSSAFRIRGFRCRQSRRPKWQNDSRSRRCQTGRGESWLDGEIPSACGRLSGDSQQHTFAGRVSPRSDSHHPLASVRCTRLGARRAPGPRPGLDGRRRRKTKVRRWVCKVPGG